jgi:hypothetical protein
MNQFRYSLCFFLLLLLNACEVVTWKKVPPEVIATVTANDGSEVAIVIQSHEINQAANKDPASVFGLSRNYEHQIFIQNQDGSKRRAITAKKPYQSTVLYYPKTAGYLLSGYIVDVKHNTIRYEKIDLNTGQTTFIRNDSGISQPAICKDLSPQSFVIEGILPSADGTIIAYFYSPTCFKATIEFLEAQTLTRLDTQHLDIKGVNEVVWPPHGSLILYSMTETEGNNAWQLLPKTPPVATHFIK